MQGAFDSGSVLWYWYDGWVALPFMLASVVLIPRLGQAIRRSELIALASMLIAILGTIPVIVVVFDRIGIWSTLSDPVTFGYASIGGTVVAILLGIAVPWSVMRTGPAAWKASGNFGTDPTVNFLGTSDDQPLIFKTNGNEAMRINTNSSVGVGTDNPRKDKLMVKGAGAIGVGLHVWDPDATYFAAIRVRSADGKNVARIQFAGDNEGVVADVSATQIAPDGPGRPTDGKLEFRTIDEGVIPTGVRHDSSSFGTEIRR